MAFLVQTLTDNRNRTVAEVRAIFTKAGGALGESGSVGWIFEPHGLLVVEPKDNEDPDDLTLQAIDAGAEDVNVLGRRPVGSAHRLRGFQEGSGRASAGMQVTTAERTMIPKTTMALEEKGMEQILRLIEKLEDLDDVQTVYTNLDLTDAEELMESLS